MSNLARRALLAVNQNFRRTAGRAIAVAVVLVAIHVGAFGFADHAALIRVANIYVSPDSSSAKLAEVERGRELVILETSLEWIHVQALIGEEKMLTGWMLDKGVVKPS